MSGGGSILELGHGGDKIKRKSKYATIFALCIMFSIMPFSWAADTNNTDVNQSETEKTANENDMANNGLKIGSTGDEVVALQNWLKTQGYYTGDIDGSFGPYTETAVKYFQNHTNITVDGYVSSESLKSMVMLSGINPLETVNTASGDSSKDSTNKNINSTTSNKKYTNSPSTTTNKKYSSKTSTTRKYSTRSTSTRRSSGSTSWNRGRGTGDCWDNSAALYRSLTSSGQKARIIQYGTSYSPRHRSVQTYSNGKWSDYNYKKNGYAVRYYATSKKPGQSVVKSS